MKTSAPVPLDAGPTAADRSGGRANPLVAIARAWDRFWFTPRDPTVLGLIRICCGLLTLYVHLGYTGDLQDFFGEHAWVDRPALQWFRHELAWQPMPSDWTETVREPYAKGYYAWSIFYHVTDPTGVMLIHAGVLVVMFLFTIGFCTRVTSVLTWVGAISYIQRSVAGLFGFDTMMNIVLLYLMVGSSGAALSVDRLIARYRAGRRARAARRAPPAPVPPTPSVSANLSLRLIQINLCIIYFAAGLSKLQGSSWWNHTAIWYTVVNPEFSPIHIGLYRAFFVFLARHRPLLELFMSFGVILTEFVEIGFPFLIWRPSMRWTMIAGAVAMHTGIAIHMGLATFSLMMVIMVMSFIPQEAVERLLGLLGRLGEAWRSRARAPEKAVEVDRSRREKVRG